ncbi:MAG: glycosyltransferase family 4 protein [Acidimicrobiales bacterium]
MRRLAPLLLSFALSVALVPVAKRVAARCGVIDYPGDGKVHRMPTPYLGGVAIALALLGTQAALGRWSEQLAALCAAGLAICVLGLIDDVRSLSLRVRLPVEGIGAAIAVSVGLRVGVGPSWFDVPASALLIVILTNSFNLLDNVDGAATAVATVTSVVVAIASGVSGQGDVHVFALAVAGATAGFLVFNWPPAAIFMGDAGSLLLGFVLTGEVLALHERAVGMTRVMSVGLILGFAIFDTTLVVLSRVRAGRPVHVGGTDHTSHRLHVHLGLSVRWTAGTIALAAGSLGAAGLVVGHEPAAMPVVVGPIAVCAAASILLLLRIPVYELGAARQRWSTSSPMRRLSPSAMPDEYPAPNARSNVAAAPRRAGRAP